jgi:hypothetical protein
MADVTYDDIAAMFLVPNGTEGPNPEVQRTPARRLRDAGEAVATIGWWSRSAAEALTALGHGFFDGYVWGRSAALGSDASPPVVVSAFGVFHAPFLAGVYGFAKTVSSAEQVLSARATGAATGLRLATSDVDVALVRELADRLVGPLSSLEPGPRPLFAALQSLPWPEDPHGRLWRATELVREHRGDGHLAACIGAGLDMAEMNVLTELWLGYPAGAYSATRGFDPQAIADAVSRLAERGWVANGEISAIGRAAREDIERVTDVSQDRLIRALGTKLDEVIADLAVVSDAVIRSQAAPADPRKRAAG